jgi:Ras GTPase-activating-like protein IQGAP2/3
VLPFTKQYFHLRDLQRSGQSPQFGSFKYGAKDLYEKGILLSIDQYSPRQFDKIDLTISSNKAGIFTLEIFNNATGFTSRIASADLRMEDLLQAQYENRASLSLFSGMVKVNLNLFLYQIHKKCVVAASLSICKADSVLAGSISNMYIRFVFFNDHSWTLLPRLMTIVETFVVCLM